MNGAPPTQVLPRAALFAAPTLEALRDDLARGRERSVGGPARAVVFDPTPERLRRAQAIVERGKPWRGRETIWFSPSGLLGAGALAFLFPGVDASFEPRVDDLAAHFGLPSPACTRPRDLTEHGIGIVGVNRLLDRVLRDLGYAPAHVAGHSVGEWSGLIATEIIPGPALDAFVASLRPGAIEVPGVVFAAAGCGVETARAALDGLADVCLTHDNCPHQVLFCGPEAPVDVALGRLRAQGVLCQKLPFQSGFHSPLFAPYLAPHRENFANLPLQPPVGTLWSATTCEPYPRDPDGIRALSIEHLIRPVRFRELIERLHAEGARVFIQVGTGSLVHFVEDTLRGRPHVALPSNVKDRGGVEQLRRLLAALFVEGGHASPALIAGARASETSETSEASEASEASKRREVGAAPQAAPARHVMAAPVTDPPLAADFEALLAAVGSASHEVLSAFARPQPAAPRERTTVQRFSLETMPELRDHSFVRQPPGWPVSSDWQPVVPMTTSVALLAQHAMELVPDRIAVAVEQVRAYRWLIVAPAVDVPVVARFDGRDRVAVRLGDYAEATVVLAPEYPEPPALPVHAREARDPPRSGGTDGPTLYADRLLFHGPAFQGLVHVGALRDDGVTGTLKSGAALGALLDNAGQLFGYWVMARHEIDRMAMPVHIARVSFFGPHPAPGEHLDCDVTIRSADARSVVADVTVSRHGRVWASIEAWEDRRFETDARLWEVMLWPEKHCLSEPQPEGFVVFDDHYRAAPTRDRLSRRYLGEEEREQYGRQGPRTQRAWLAGRIAAKDAVRDLLRRAGRGPLFPVEVTIANEPSGRPVAKTRASADVRVSIAHKDGIAVALAREGCDVGIDVERIAPRQEAFAALALTEAEQRLVADEPPDVGWTRLWCAKEAAAKAAGTGLQGAPHRFPVRDRAGTRLLVGDRWTQTKRHDDFIIGWTTT